MGLREKLGGIFYGYRGLLICVILHALGAEEYFYGFSVFYTTMLAEYGWSSAVTVGGLLPEPATSSMSTAATGWRSTCSSSWLCSPL